MLNLINRRRVALVTATILGIIVLSSWTRSSSTIYGKAEPLGNASIRSYVTYTAAGTPAAVGVEFSAEAMRNLPAEQNTYSRCHDVDGNGAHAKHECIGDFETILQIPRNSGDSMELPFKWVSVNWNPEGHAPPAPPGYAKPHFDFHFYTWDQARVNEIATGTCGEFVDCEDFKRGSKPLPADYLPAGHIDVGAVVPRMGNHLLDSSSPELQPDPKPFTRTFIYGAFDGELIFWEPMITLDVLKSADNDCYAISQPAKFARSGYYPAAYCIRHDIDSGRYTVSLEQFVFARGE